MKMNLNMVNRAMYFAGLLQETESVGMELHSTDDKDNPDKKYWYDFCKALYFSTFLEALSEVPWTMGRRRKRLLRTMLPHGDSGFLYTYNLPYDCARPVELSGHSPYIIEGKFLCTDAAEAELLYVSDGRIIPRDAFFERVTITELAEGKYDLILSPGYLDEWDIPVDFMIAGGPKDITDDAEEVIRPYEDYPDYSPPRYEPKFDEYLEMMIAAKFAVKNTQQPRLHDTLMQKAMLIKQEAVNSTRSITADKDKPSKDWADRLGISLDF